LVYVLCNNYIRTIGYALWGPKDPNLEEGYY